MISVKIHRKKKSKRKPGKRAATKFKKPSKNTEPKAPKGETKKVKVRSEIEESMVQSIISSETQTELAPAIKSIFEQTKEVDVVESLTDYIQNKEIEIQRMCESNFQVCLFWLE
jgi:Glu-tRNA(Gln) amidotransferase subunit E-like FAD-binding protein